jgi:predicted LPLAT superfamily acyltransferase
VAAAQMSRHWRSVPERGTILGIRVIGFTYRLFGRRIARAVVWLVSLFYALFDYPARRVSRDYLRRMGLPSSFGSVHEHFFTFGCVALDRLVFMLGKSDSEFEVNKIGLPVVLEMAAHKRGAILLGSHIGSFEAMRALNAEIPLTIIVDFRNAKRITAVLEELAPGAKLKVISIDPSRGTSMLDVKACVDRGEFVAILGDRVGERERVTRVEFLGDEATLPISPYLLAHMLSCPVYFVAGLFFPPNRYDLFCEPFAESVKLPRKNREEAAKVYAQKYADVMESFARKAPYNWFNFFDFWRT